MHVSITPEIITHIFGIPITNTLVASLLTTVVLVVIVYFCTRKVNEIPRGWQNLFEMIIESLFKMIDDVTGNRKQTYQFFPLIATIFIFIIVSNLSLIHISEPTRRTPISYAVFCLKKK